jgi:ribosomal protein L7Ae-like RNA K-turn-binding protein
MVIMEKRLLSMLSLCKKARAMSTGAQSCENVIRAGNAKIVIVCMDASDNTKKKFSQKAFYYGVPYKEMFTMDVLNHAIGEQNRSVAVITEENFSARILELIGVDLAQ